MDSETDSFVEDPGVDSGVDSMVNSGSDLLWRILALILLWVLIRI